MAAAPLPRGARLAEALSLRGHLSAKAVSGYAVQCGVYPGQGYLATVQLSVPGKPVTLTIQIPMYNGPGQYLVELAAGSATNIAAARLGAYGSADAGSVTIAAGGRGGALTFSFGRSTGRSATSTEQVSGDWTCAPAGAGYGASRATGAINAYQDLTVSGALAGHVGPSDLPGQELAAGAPNCGVFRTASGGHFNLAMVVNLEAHHYILEVQLQQYQGAGQYYPSFTAQSLPRQDNWATAEVVRDAAPASPGEIPSSSWAAVGGDFRLNPGLTSGLMAIRFMNRTGASFVVTGSWSC
ncbi:MAG: hypothetical protein ACYCYK_06855 [Candidatus Dormibacteria bacterium]